MINLSKCPKCNKPLINEYKNQDFYIKYCHTVSHHIVITISKEECKYLDIYMLDFTRITWSFIENKVSIFSLDDNKKNKIMNLPFFEPDLSDYDALINKIKVYTTFS